MKLRNCLCVAALLVCSLSGLSAAPKLLLHFDVNKTLIADDAAGGKTADQLLMHAMADRYYDRWDERVPEPISYLEYVREYLLPGKASDAGLGAAREAQVQRFLEFLREKNHFYTPWVERQYSSLKNKLAQSGTLVFTSFYRLLDYLDERKVDYTVLLRTFGSDLARVTRDVNAATESSFFNLKGRFKNKVLFVEAAPMQERCIERVSEIYQFFKTTSHIAIQDNWEDWMAHEGTQEYSKLFPIDLQDKSVVSLFFDDNVRVEPQSRANIVNPVDVHTNQPLNVVSLVENKNIFRVDAIDAILDDEYFIHLVEAAINASTETAQEAV
jgi:hypothetical protein